VHKFFYCIAIFLILSCSSEKPSQPSRPPVSSGSGLYSLQIAPANALRNSTLYLIAQGFNTSDAKIEWLVNDELISSPSASQFNTAETKKGDKIQARAAINGKEILSNIIQIKNSLPEISKVRFLPEVFKIGDNLSVEGSGSDIDGDEVAISYEWTKNGKPAGSDRRLEVPLKRGDNVSVKITPFDGEAYGHPVILHREIVNLPPIIIEDMKFSFDEKIYTFQVKATDPDGDSLTYSIKTPPAGMTINPSTGLVKWDVPPEFKGKVSVSISVTDGHGGEAIQGLTIEIGPETK
jgi:hypothetical protein